MADGIQLEAIARLGNLLEGMKSIPVSRWEKYFRDGLERQLRKNTDLSEDAIQSRMGTIGTLHEAGKDQRDLEWVLGYFSEQETFESWIGKSLEDISPESKLGRYLQKTGASTLLRNFSTNTNEEGARRGPERLVVAVSAKSFQTFKKIFFDENAQSDSLAHLHTPEQGTLLALSKGHIYHWGSSLAESIRLPDGTSTVVIHREYSSPLRIPKIGTVIPAILLSASEAGRVQQFLHLLTRDLDAARHPWMIPAMSNAKFSRYCAMGGYNSCTHWLMNIPAGDDLVSKYLFPGKVDAYAYNKVEKAPQVQPLQPIKKNLGTRSREGFLGELHP